jgi:hypothetical protein
LRTDFGRWTLFDFAWGVANLLCVGCGNRDFAQSAVELTKPKNAFRPTPVRRRKRKREIRNDRLEFGGDIALAINEEPVLFEIAITAAKVCKSTNVCISPRVNKDSVCWARNDTDFECMLGLICDKADCPP